LPSFEGIFIAATPFFLLCHIYLYIFGGENMRLTVGTLRRLIREAINETRREPRVPGSNPAHASWDMGSADWKGLGWENQVMDAVDDYGHPRKLHAAFDSRVAGGMTPSQVRSKVMAFVEADEMMSDSIDTVDRELSKWMSKSGKVTESRRFRR
jgi:hypothetical protein